MDPLCGKKIKKIAGEKISASNNVATQKYPLQYLLQ